MESWVQIAISLGTFTIINLSATAFLIGKIVQTVKDPDGFSGQIANVDGLLHKFLFVAGMMALTHWMGPKRLTSDKLQTFESGIEQQGNARRPMAIKYFLVAILFVLFDVHLQIWLLHT